MEERISEESEEAELLEGMADRARSYISGFRWSKPIVNQEMLFGVGNVLAINLFTFSELIGGSDLKLWVMVGDLPTAYLVVIDDDSAQNALDRYCDLMVDWCEAVEGGGKLEEVFPVNAAPTQEHAAMLRSRVDLIRSEILSEVSTELIQP